LKVEKQDKVKVDIYLPRTNLYNKEPAKTFEFAARSWKQREPAPFRPEEMDRRKGVYESVQGGLRHGPQLWSLLRYLRLGRSGEGTVVPSRGNLEGDATGGAQA
jgi:hypothetical protein